MKVIDLLNKIANGEEVPKKIMYEHKAFHYVEEYKDFEIDETGWCLFGDDFEKHYGMTAYLNDEVEIIEEDKKIEKLDIKQEKNIKNNWKWKCNGYNISTPQKIMADKINELIDEVNKLKGGNNE